MKEQENYGPAPKPEIRTNANPAPVKRSLMFIAMATLSLNSWAFDGAVVNLNDIDGDNGFAITAATEGDAGGYSMAEAGDINNDGIDDFVIGAPGTDTNGDESGAAYVVFGTAAGFATPYLLADIASGDGSAGFVLNGVATEEFAGLSVGGAGDVNGDGIEDMIIGAPHASPGGRFEAGSAYVLFGRNGNFGSTVELSTLGAGDGSTGFVIHGETAGDRLGSSVTGAADVTGDEIDDLIIGAPGAETGLGYSYLVFGRDTGFGATLEVSTLSVGDGSTGVRLSASTSQAFGTAVSPSSDVNNDGIDDVIVGAPAADNNGTNAGEAFVVFGRDFVSVGNFGSTMDVSSLTGVDGFVMRGATGAGAGSSVSDLGDFNDDGIDDILLSASNANNGDGEVYVVFGKETAFSPIMDLSTIADGDGSEAIVLRAAAQGDVLGADVSGVGDFNGDGVDDLAIGVTGADTDDGAGGGVANAGAVFVIYGNSDGFGPVLNTADIYAGEGEYGLVFAGVAANGKTGFAVRGTGDVNGDGQEDIIFSAYDSGDSDGQAYVVYGFQGTPPDPDMIARYNFEYHLDDLSMFGNDLVPATTAAYRGGADGSSLSLGTSDFVWRGSTPSLASRRDISIAARFNLDANSASPIVAKYTLVRSAGKYQPSYGLEVMTAGRIRFSWLLRGTSAATNCTTGYHALNARLENVVAATRDSATGIVRIYVNGVQKKMCRTTPGILHTDFRPLIVGSWAPGLPAGRTPLRLNDLMIYRKALNVTEVRALGEN